VASGVNNAVSRIAALMAIAILGAVVLSLFQTNLIFRINDSELNLEQRSMILSQSNKLGGIEIPESFDKNAQAEAIYSVKSSFVYGFRWAMGINAFLALISSIISMIIIKNPISKEII